MYLVDIRQNITIKELDREGAKLRRLEYLETFPTKYVFPAFDSNSTNPMEEEFSLKPLNLVIN